jgi:TfoX/Sxy family transcriptional regulator of competence genes
MATSQETVDYMVDQLSDAGEIRAKRMFGEWGIYCDDKFIGVICNDTLFIKTTPAGLDHCGEDAEQAPPYKGAKPSLVISEAQLEDRTWLKQLINVTYAALPKPKPKKKKAKA